VSREEEEADLIATSPALHLLLVLPETTALAASGVAAAAAAGYTGEELEEEDPDFGSGKGTGKGGWRFASATTRWPFARQWRSEKKLSLPPDTSAITFSPDGEAEGVILVDGRVWTLSLWDVKCQQTCAAVRCSADDRRTDTQKQRKNVSWMTRSDWGGRDMPAGLEAGVFCRTR
jgi:hypothetical protein